MDEELALADAFRVGQARGALVIQRALRSAFERALDPYDVEGSFPRYLELASRLLAVGHAQSAQAALDYYRRARIAAGLAPDIPGFTLAALVPEAVETSLRVTGPVLVKRLTGEGKPPLAAAALAQAATLRMAKRLVLNGSRDAVTAAVLADDDALAFARVSDGSSCAFCAMLIARGPVYKAVGATRNTYHGADGARVAYSDARAPRSGERVAPWKQDPMPGAPPLKAGFTRRTTGGNTAAFAAHDGCGCTARPVYKTDPSRGWTPEARALSRLYQDAQDGTHEDADGNPIYSFRVLLGQVRSGKYDLAA